MTNKIALVCLAFLGFSCQKNDKKLTEFTGVSHPNAIKFDPNTFEGKHQAKAMVLGVFHFNYPENDAHVSTHTINILEEKRQKELDQLLQLLSKYKPTKILLEFPREKGDSIMNPRYHQYLKGEWDISNQRNEWYQIGFKLAQKLQHPHIYSVDVRSPWCGPELDWDTYDSEGYLKSKNQWDKSVRYDYEKFYAHGDSLTVNLSLVDYLAYDNSPEIRLKDHQAYLTEMVLEGAGDHYLGAASVSRWYDRNIKIFANTYDLTDFDQEERILLIYGSGHVWQLRQLFTDSPDYQYVEPNTYLVSKKRS